MSHNKSRHKEGDLVYVPSEVTLWMASDYVENGHPTKFRSLERPVGALYLGKSMFMRREFAKVLIEGQQWYVSPTALFTLDNQTVKEEKPHGDS